MDDRERIARQLEQIIEVEVQARMVGDDWVSAFVDGDAIGTDEAAFIEGCSAQTIRRHAAEAAATDNPLGVRFVQGVWLISRRRQLDSIQAVHGLHARLAAMSRAEKYAKMIAPQQTSRPDDRAATG